MIFITANICDTPHFNFNIWVLVVIRLTCSMHVIYARRAYLLSTLQQRIQDKTSTNQQRIRIAIQ
jgi:hypothetical protein